MWGERQRGRGQSRLVVGSTRNRLLLRFLGREGLLEVLFVVPHVYHVAEVRHAEDHERDVHDDADGDPGGGPDPGLRGVRIVRFAPPTTSTRRMSKA